MFEIRHSDLAGRIGRLRTKHGIVETPAFIPVVHPVRQEVSIDELKKMGFDMLITNAYITLKEYGEDARDVHDILNFQKPIMTDSGGYQVLVYGSVDVDHQTMARFQARIGSDVAVPLDKPTGFGLPRSKAERYVELTLKAAEDTIRMSKEEGRDEGDDAGTIWAAPVQGGEHLDLVEYSSRRLLEMGYEFFALGSPTELMEAYEFYTLARMILAARRVIPLSKPMHLFGAGHPLTIPLAVALGCDTFDSASYILYAKDGRYILPNGTVNIDELEYLPCICPICSSIGVKELRDMSRDERIVKIALHNLYTIKREVDNVKQAIVEGRLWEYVIQRSLSHPKLVEANNTLVESAEYLEQCTPIFKDRALFLSLPIDQYRPELTRFRRLICSNIRSDKSTLVLLIEPEEHPFYTSSKYKMIKDAINAIHDNDHINNNNKIGDDVQIAYYSPFLGVVPEEVSDVYPASHMVSVRSVKYYEFPTMIDSIIHFIRSNRFKRVLIEVDERSIQFMRSINDKLQEVEIGYCLNIEDIIAFIRSKQW
ncbi:MULTISPECIES: tRNA guanosine(15) transglycosylase TgtA [Candidatus Nitrosocaldus]|uniref:tRNA-guanine(15) transglycosylase n=1 Tax=Candidatus Nitrosocaldus cavascurensis TaxID=2058097 RepID=A0A2K5AQG0_9ARCH|nr:MULTISPECIES: tRNA guanosine(15) transglycosylase TgtA [Candidatus Nitrosocaldus]SPC33892.1 tRNA-guanine(15) transglycosylase [Candidatus Nitrosocaldus cavascurensis]